MTEKLQWRYEVELWHQWPFFSRERALYFPQDIRTKHVEERIEFLLWKTRTKVHTPFLSCRRGKGRARYNRNVHICISSRQRKKLNFPNTRKLFRRNADQWPTRPYLHLHPERQRELRVFILRNDERMKPLRLQCSTAWWDKCEQCIQARNKAINVSNVYKLGIRR